VSRERPILALLAAPGTSSRAVPLLGLLGRHAEVVSWHRRGSAVPDAVLATSVDVLPTLATAPPAPVGVWVDHHDQVDRALEAGADLLLTSEPTLEGRGAVVVPRIGIEVDRWAPVAPLVRARWRERLGLPEQHVVRIDGGVEPGDGERSLMVASAAVVSGPATLLALALATPVVTSADTARRLGLRAGREVEVAAGRDQALALAEEVAADDARASALSRRARLAVERHHDLGRPAVTVARVLALAPDGLGPLDRIDDRLAELATPTGSPIRHRAALALAALTADGGGSRP
jgi:hypothetical protein